jgi:hypothetical protein
MVNMGKIGVVNLKTSFSGWVPWKNGETNNIPNKHPKWPLKSTFMPQAND